MEPSGPAHGAGYGETGVRGKRISYPMHRDCYRSSSPCRTCGETVPETRTDRRYCSWQHDPELLDNDELAALIAAYPVRARVKRAS